MKVKMNKKEIREKIRWRKGKMAIMGKQKGVTVLRKTRRIALNRRKEQKKVDPKKEVAQKRGVAQGNVVLVGPGSVKKEEVAHVQRNGKKGGAVLRAGKKEEGIIAMMSTKT